MRGNQFEFIAIVLAKSSMYTMHALYTWGRGYKLQLYVSYFLIQSIDCQLQSTHVSPSS